MSSLRLRASVLAVLSLGFASPASAQSLEDVYGPLPDISSDMPLTRGELVAWLTLDQLPMVAFTDCYAKLSPSDYTLLFSDVPTNHLYGLHLCAAIRYGLIDGYSDASFRPNSLVNMAETAKILTQVLNLEVPPMQAGDEWYTPYLRSLAARNMIPTEVTGPAMSVTPELVAQMMDRLLASATPYPFRTEDEVRAW